MPFRYENYRCLVVFVDPLVGEFQHEIFGETLLPELGEDVKPNLNIIIDQPTKFDL